MSIETGMDKDFESMVFSAIIHKFKAPDGYDKYSYIGVRCLVEGKDNFSVSLVYTSKKNKLIYSNKIYTENINKQIKAFILLMNFI